MRAAGCASSYCGRRAFPRVSLGTSLEDTNFLPRALSYPHGTARHRHQPWVFRSSQTESVRLKCTSSSSRQDAEGGVHGTRQTHHAPSAVAGPGGHHRQQQRPASVTRPQAFPTAARRRTGQSNAPSAVAGPGGHHRQQRPASVTRPSPHSSQPPHHHRHRPPTPVELRQPTAEGPPSS